jgi:hypothetical protein
MRSLKAGALPWGLAFLLSVPHLAACADAQSPGPTTPGAASTSSAPGEVRHVGRFDRSDPTAPRGGWSGISATARFTGSTISVDLDDAGGNMFAVILDGVVRPEKLQATGGRRVYELASELSAGTHEISVYRLTEALQGETQFFGFRCAGRFLAPPPNPERRIEVIGDSITCGYGVDGPDQHCPFSAATENHYRTYAAIAARELGADLVTLAWSGKGVFNNRGDLKEPMPELYRRTLPQRAGGAWDFAGWIPQAVIINLCTNDFADTVPDRATFVGAYLDLVRFVRRNYGEAFILCALGPMLSDDWPQGQRQLSSARAYINEVVSAMNGAGDGRVALLEFAPQDGSTGYGCDWHPSAATQARMGTRLTAELRARLGW